MTAPSTCVGQTSLLGLFAFVLIYSAEEIKDASETLPKAMMSSVAVNGVLGFIMLVTLCFTLGEVETVLESATGFPFIQIFYNTTGSLAATNAMTAVLIVTLTASTITEVATASRQLWSFARDEGVPFSSFFAYVCFLDALQRDRLTKTTGYTGMEHPTQLRDGVAGSDCSPVDDQHRIPGSFECDHISDNHFLDVSIHCIDWLRALEATPWRTTATSPLVTGPVRPGGKCRSAMLPTPRFRLCFLPPINARDPRDDELECGHVRWCHRIGNDLLLG